MKFPDLNWDQISAMPSQVYMSKLEEVWTALGNGAGRVQAIDTVVGEVLQGRQHMSVCQGEDGKGYEMFQDGKWDTASDFGGLVLFMKMSSIHCLAARAQMHQAMM